MFGGVDNGRAMGRERRTIACDIHLARPHAQAAKLPRHKTPSSQSRVEARIRYMRNWCGGISGRETPAVVDAGGGVALAGSTNKKVCQRHEQGYGSHCNNVVPAAGFSAITDSYAWSQQSHAQLQMYSSAKHLQLCEGTKTTYTYEKSVSMSSNAIVYSVRPVVIAAAAPRNMDDKKRWMRGPLAPLHNPESKCMATAK